MVGSLHFRSIFAGLEIGWLGGVRAVAYGHDINPGFSQGLLASRTGFLELATPTLVSRMICTLMVGRRDSLCLLCMRSSGRFLMNKTDFAMKNRGGVYNANPLLFPVIHQGQKHSQRSTPPS